MILDSLKAERCLSELIATLVMPIYFAVRERPFWFVLVGAGACGLFWMWRSRASRHEAQTASFDANVPHWFKAFSNLAMLLAVAAVFAAVHSVIYLLVRLPFCPIVGFANL